MTRPDQHHPRTAGMRKHAHDSGDGETIYHCPFCGSGQVLARSDRTIECQFCHTCFTVQVQPQYPAFPQTINGQPVQVPGMPGQVDPGSSGFGDPMPGGPMDGGFAPDEDPMDADEVDDEGNPPGDEGAGEGEEDDENPFAKKSYVTHEGNALSREQYLKYLAIRNSGKPKVTAARLKGR